MGLSLKEHSIPNTIKYSLTEYSIHGLEVNCNGPQEESQDADERREFTCGESS